MTAEIGIIGGSGLYKIDEIRGLEEKRLRTPFGEPSDAYMVGELSGRRVAFLARHGRGHRLAPSEINFRANIYGMKMLGVERIVSAGAVGSMKEEIHPTDLVFPDQFIDRTVGRVSTFFGDGLVAHVAFADPVCADLKARLAASARDEGARVHDGGSYVCIEGPQFSTRAESHLYRSWGVSVIGMTNLQEAKLAREAEICYATMALVTDYDCWHVSAESVNVATVLDYLRRNAEMARAVMGRTIASLPSARSCECGAALAAAIISDRAVIPQATREKLSLLVGKYLD
ncbi:MAG TPA: S-methyl-5'-thioadenosine phosphorylase [Candidatus Polarisedimenticolia bacterium]|nr:S-methyl-5'-thioadenosine phosphorylase [Candidatus Polarisedimenticolia bacterium]